MLKISSPRLAKMWKQLSSKAQKIISESLPADYSRAVYKMPTAHMIREVKLPENADKYPGLLGAGIEGIVVPSMSGGGKMNTATKIFYDTPGHEGIFSGGRYGVKKMLGNAKVKDKVDFMRNFPKISPEVIGSSPRSITMEKLYPISGDTRDPSVLKELPSYTLKQLDFLGNELKKHIQHTPSGADSMLLGMSRWLNTLGIPPTPPEQMLEQINASKPFIEQITNALRNNGAKEVSIPEFLKFKKELNSYINTEAHPNGVDPALAYVQGNPLTLNRPGGGISSVTDFMGTGQPNPMLPKTPALHNVMATENGRYVIVDPGVIMPYPLVVHKG